MKLPRKYLSAKGLLHVVHEVFNKIPMPRKLAERTSHISLHDCLMSALAIFSLKYPSLLKFDENKAEKHIKHNLQTLYHVKKAPCDTYLRERCDEVEPVQILKAFKKVFSCIQRGKLLEGYNFMDNHYLLAGDGTGFFKSPTVCCDNCCVKHHNKCHIKFITKSPEDMEMLERKKNTYLIVKNQQQFWEVYYTDRDENFFQISKEKIAGLAEILEKKQLSKQDKNEIKQLLLVYYQETYPDQQVTYYHNMFCAAIVHPENKMVLPFAPEPIMKTDGAEKNDCEQNASKRLYANIRREHPHLKLIVVEDAIAANVPHLRDLKALNMKYIIGVKKGDHKFLFDLVEKSSYTEYSHKTEDGVTHHYRYINQIQLNQSHPDYKVNFIEYTETDSRGKEQYFCWITDIIITNENVYQIMKGGRSNWRIENNTFNTIKNQNYHFEHNFGHGYKNLCTVFSMLLMLAFLIDQVQELSCDLFKKARAKFKSRTSLWEKMHNLFTSYYVNTWEDLFLSIANGYDVGILAPDSS
jgi:hypothetical protein